MTDDHHDDARERLDVPSPSAEGAPDVLWAWVDRLERIAEAGLHAQGFVHELSNAMTAVMGNCELALLGQTAEEIRPDLERVVGQLERVRERLSNFRAYLGAPREHRRSTTLRAGIDEALRFLSYPLRKLTPTVHGSDPVLVDVDDDVAVGLPFAKLIHVMAAVIHDFVVQAHAFHGPVRIAADRRGDRILVRLTQPEGAEPRRGDEYWQASETGLELAVARGNVERAGGALEGSAAVGQISLTLPVARDRSGGSRDEVSRYEPWSPHRRGV